MTKDARFKSNGQQSAATQRLRERSKDDVATADVVPAGVEVTITIIERAVASRAAGEDVACDDQYVTLRKAAKLVGRSKRGLESYKNHPHDPLPPADVKGGNGKPAEWLYRNIRPWLNQTFGRRLPERMPNM